MSMFVQFDPRKQPKCKIELHVHLDGAVRLTTIWELAQKKGISLGVKSLDDLIQECTIKHPSTLCEFLKPFGLISPVYCGDLIAIERIAYEFCEDSAAMNVLYAEVRYCPHLLCSTSGHTRGCPPANSFHTDGEVTPPKVVEAINRGLKRGEADFGLKVRTILCCYRLNPEWSEEILHLCLKYQEDGVVGIDICGDEAVVMANPEDIEVFQKAVKLGIHRTAHAAEAGPASNALLALKKMMVERIGHGYHVVEDESVYKTCLNAGVHFEACPYSSYLTGSVPLMTSKHPIVRFAEDVANFSISRDDPFIIQKDLDQEYALLKQLGLKDVHIARANFNAAKSCFLPDVEKKELLLRLQEIYCI